MHQMKQNPDVSSAPPSYLAAWDDAAANLPSSNSAHATRQPALFPTYSTSSSAFSSSSTSDSSRSTIAPYRKQQKKARKLLKKMHKFSNCFGHEALLEVMDSYKK